MSSTCAISQADILDSLDDLGYDTKAFSDKDFAAATTLEYCNLISSLSIELKTLCAFEECVHPISDMTDETTFNMELSSMLREMECPHPNLIEGPIGQRLATKESRLELLIYLCTELQAARMCAFLRRSSTETTSTGVQGESKPARHLRVALSSLGFDKPPDSITAEQLFSKLKEKLRQQMEKIANKTSMKPLFNGLLSDKQWQTVDTLNHQMNKEYQMRSEMLLQRLDVTVRSFLWSERVKKLEVQVMQTFNESRCKLSKLEPVHIADLLAARDDLALIEKTSNTNVRAGTRTQLNKLLLKRGPPDRGGRPTEIQAPPPEMPPWQKRTPGRGGGPQAQRRGRGDGYAGRGSGRVQGGGWQQQNYGNYGDQRGNQQQWSGDGYNNQQQQYQYDGAAQGYQQGGMGYQQQNYQQGGRNYQQQNYQDGGAGYQQPRRGNYRR